MSPTLLARLQAVARETRELHASVNRAYPDLREPFRPRDYFCPLARMVKFGRGR